MNVGMTKKELATVAGYSYRRLHDIDQSLPRDRKLFVKSEAAPQKYDLALFVQRWVAYNQQSASEETEELSVVKAQHELVKKEKTEIEVARLKGEYVHVQDVQRMWGNIAGIVANRLNNLPRKLAPALVMIDNPDMIEAAIEREVRDALNMIASAPLPGGEPGISSDASVADEEEDEDE